MYASRHWHREVLYFVPVAPTAPANDSALSLLFPCGVSGAHQEGLNRVCLAARLQGLLHMAKRYRVHVRPGSPSKQSGVSASRKKVELSGDRLCCCVARIWVSFVLVFKRTTKFSLYDKFVTSVDLP